MTDPTAAAIRELHAACEENAGGGSVACSYPKCREGMAAHNSNCRNWSDGFLANRDVEQKLAEAQEKLDAMQSSDDAFNEIETAERHAARQEKAR